MVDLNQNDDIFAGVDQLLSGNFEVIKRAHMIEGIYAHIAPNPVVFIESSKFLAAPKLFPVQFEVVRDFFELLCPRCNDVHRIISVRDVPREKQILFEYNECPVCHLKKNSIPSEFKFYNELVAVMGMRSGKSFLSAAISAFMVHEFLCIDNLQGQLGLAKGQLLDIAFVATSAEQSEDTVYGQFKGLCRNSPWFKDLKKELIHLEKTSPNYTKGSLFRENDTEVYFVFKELKIEAMHSNSAGLVGHTRLGAVIDELARFDSGVSKRGADEVYLALKRSLTTVNALVERRRQDLKDFVFPYARMINISSPMFEDDKIMRLLKEAEISNKMFTVHKSTFDANPTIHRDDPDIVDQFTRDPLKAKRDLDAQPVGDETNFITDPRVIDMCIDLARPSMFRARDNFFDVTAQGVVFNYVSLILEAIKYQNLQRYVIHCDPGRKHDSFCLAIGHLENDLVIIDGALEAKPVRSRDNARVVHFPSMVKLILELRKKLTLEIVSYDHWNSADQIDILRHNGILAVGKTIDRDDHIRFLDSITYNKIRFPAREVDNPNINFLEERNIPCAKALYELKNLRDNGVKVDHPRNGSNDMIQCYVGVHRILTNKDKLLSKYDLSSLNRNRMTKKSSLRPSIGKYIRLKRFI